MPPFLYPLNSIETVFLPCALREGEGCVSSICYTYMLSERHARCETDATALVSSENWFFILGDVPPT
jgi:hypothetical protein